MQGERDVAPNGARSPERSALQPEWGEYERFMTVLSSTFVDHELGRCPRLAAPSSGMFPISLRGHFPTESKRKLMKI
jgi:hypothetical protein